MEPVFPIGARVGEGPRLLGSPDRFVHAKALVFEHHDGSKTLVTGSANPSRAAWLLATAKRNAELVVVERDAAARVESLGLDQLLELPEFDGAAWQLLADREHARMAGPAPSPAKHPPMTTGWLDQGVAMVPASFVVGAEPEQLELIDDRDQCLVRANHIAFTEHLAHVRFDAASPGDESLCLRNAATGALALLQRRAELEGRASGSHRQQFKAALLGLETDGAQLEQLFAIVSKVLDEPVIASSSVRAAKTTANAEADAVNATRIISFESSIHDSQRARVIPRGTRALAPTSDLAAIIEFLIYQLGIGRETELDDEDADVTTSEEELSDLKHEGAELSDAPGDAETDEPPPPLTGHARARMCQRKVKTLLSRLQHRAEKLADGADPLAAIVRTVAVLGVLRHLRVHEASIPWRPRNVSLIPAKEERKFFDKMCPLLYATETGFVDRALADRDGVVFDELSSLHSLMTWLAADCGVDLGALEQMDVRGHEIEQRWVDLGRALGPLAACASDPNARGLVEALATKSAPNEAWLRRHLAWGQRGLSGAAVHLGSVVAVPKLPGCHLVVRVRPEKVGVYVLSRDRVVFYALSRRPLGPWPLGGLRRVGLVVRARRRAPHPVRGGSRRESPILTISGQPSLTRSARRTSGLRPANATRCARHRGRRGRGSARDPLVAARDRSPCHQPIRGRPKKSRRADGRLPYDASHAPRLRDTTQAPRARRHVSRMCCDSAPAASLNRNTPAPNGTRKPNDSDEMRAKSAPSLRFFAPRRLG